MSFLRFAISIAVLLVSFSVFAETSINGPSRIGVPLNKPFVFRIPAKGDGDLLFRADDLPQGLVLNPFTGVITGTSSDEGVHQVTFMVLSREGYFLTGSNLKTVEMVVGSDQSIMSLTPVMGWNPWYVWGCNIDDKKIRDAADRLVSSGLAAYGYNYINLDDCWQGQRDSNGEMVPNERFPDMKALADYVHSKGLRIGIYTGPGEKTCAGYPASKDHVEQDVQTYSKWGMDFIKYDWCQHQPQEAAPYISVYKEMGEILSRAPRAMTYMICEYGRGEPWKWAPSVGGNMWRTDDDLADVWESIMRNGFGRVPMSSYASPGHFNDLDMLMIGKANWPAQLGQYTIPNAPPRPTKLTLPEQQTHISLWSMMASPLLFSGDLAQLDSTAMSMLTNVDVINIDQDSLGAPVRIVSNDGKTEILSRKLADGSTAVGMFNLTTSPTVIKADYKALGLPLGRQLKLRNLWSHKEVTSEVTHTSVQGSVAPHGVMLLKISAQ